MQRKMGETGWENQTFKVKNANTADAFLMYIFGEEQKGGATDLSLLSQHDHFTVVGCLDRIC